MRCYATQYACLSYGGRGLLEDPRIHGFEVRWELTAPPTARHGMDDRDRAGAGG